MELLIAHGANCTIKNKNGDTPLRLASHKKDERNLKPLLGEGNLDNDIRENSVSSLGVTLVQPFLEKIKC